MNFTLRPDPPLCYVSTEAPESPLSLGSGASALKLQWTSSRRILEACIVQEMEGPSHGGIIVPDPGGGKGVGPKGGEGDERPPAKMRKKGGGQPRRRSNPKQLLQERLDRLNLDMVIMVGDGNCQVGAILSRAMSRQYCTESLSFHVVSIQQFRALSSELYGSQDHHLEVRSEVMGFICDHSEEFVPFLDEDFDDYIKVSL